MNSKQRGTLKAIFAKSTRSNLAWSDVEALLVALGAQRSEGAGSRVRFLLNGIRITLHRPHPQREASKAQIDSVRDFLIAAEVKP